MVEIEVYNKTIGKFFRQKRIEKGYTMDELAHRCGHKSKGWYSKIEYGTSNLNVRDCIKLCNVMHIDLNELQRYVEAHIEDDAHE